MLSILIPLVAVAIGATAQIAANSWGQDRVDVFGAAHAHVWHKYYTKEGGWEPHGKFENLGQADENFTGQPAVVSWAEGRLDFFAVGQNATPYHKYWDGSNWGPKDLEALSGKNETKIYSDLAAASWGAGRLDVAGLSGSGSYQHLYWDGHQWNGWEDLGHPDKGLNFSSSPSIVSWGENRFDIFGIAQNGSAFHKFWAGDHYEPSSGWELLAWQAPKGGFKKTTVTSTSWGANRLDLWAVGADDKLYHTLWDHDYYGPWETLGGDFETAPSVVHWAPNRIDIVGHDQKTSEYRFKFWDGYGWRPNAVEWYSKGKFEGPPSLTSWAPNNLNILGVKANGTLAWQAWNQSYWIPSADEFIELGDIANPFEHGEELRTQQVVMGNLKVDI